MIRRSRPNFGISRVCGPRQCVRDRRDRTKVSRDRRDRRKIDGGGEITSRAIIKNLIAAYEKLVALW